MTGIAQKIGWRLEAILVGAVLECMRVLPARLAARMMGGLAASLGPWFPVSKIADRNLRLAMPDLDAAARQKLIKQTWYNLGCTMGEYPHLVDLQETAAGPGWEIDPASRAILDAQAARGGPAIMFSGHIGNWEMLPAICAAHGLVMSSAYRPPANPIIDRMLVELRRAAVGAVVPMFPKGRVGARGAIEHLAKGGNLGLLIDQKMNDGIESTLFGHPAMTAPALATLALRYRCPVLPGRLIRLGPARLRLQVDPPLLLPDTGNKHTDAITLTRQLNECLERWITSAPADWLWFHRRWPKAIYQNPAR